MYSEAWQYELYAHNILSLLGRGRRGLKNSTLVCRDGVVVYKLRAFSGENEGAIEPCDKWRRLKVSLPSAS
jgi:hypothetical protein